MNDKPIPTARPEEGVTGRDLVAAMAKSPLQDVPFERCPIVAPVRDISL